MFAGLCGGILAGLLGVGGGIVIVPVLFHLFSLIGIDPAVKMHLAVGTSLASIIPTSISSIRSHLKRGAVDKELLRSWAPSIAVGVLAGTVLAGLVRGPVLTGVFAVIALLVATHMTVTREGMRIAEQLPTGLLKHVIAALIGCFSAMMGIGGGTLTVPTLALCNFPIRRAVATAAAIGLIIAIPGTIGFIVSGLGVASRPPLSIGYVSVMGFLLIAPVSMLAAPVGARIAHTIDPELLRKAFALFLALTSARMFYGLLG
ncbi:MAG: TSUP family transporter [Azospirillum sp.]|nr:TSUP family transporter [Azospirillum sp.]